MRIDQRWPEDGSEIVYGYFPSPLKLRFWYLQAGATQNPVAIFRE